MRLRPLALLLPLPALVALGGCSGSVSVGGKTLKTNEAEASIKSLVTSKVGARVKSVSCPEDIDVKTGATFTCTVVGTDGSKGAITAKQTDDKGNFDVDLPLIRPRDAEQAMTTSIKKQVSVKNLAITCPEIVVFKTGGTFRCSGIGDGVTAPIAVTQVDNTGHIRFKLLPASG
jgi:hypothetical protein